MSVEKEIKHSLKKEKSVVSTTDFFFFLIYFGKIYNFIKIYEPNAIKFKDVKASTDYLSINIEENYAINKNGKKVQ